MAKSKTVSVIDAKRELGLRYQKCVAARKELELRLEKAVHDAKQNERQWQSTKNQLERDIKKTREQAKRATHNELARLAEQLEQAQNGFADERRAHEATHAALRSANVELNEVHQRLAAAEMSAGTPIGGGGMDPFSWGGVSSNGSSSGSGVVVAGGGSGGGSDSEVSSSVVTDMGGGDYMLGPARFGSDGQYRQYQRVAQQQQRHRPAGGGQQQQQQQQQRLAQQHGRRKKKSGKPPRPPSGSHAGTRGGSGGADRVVSAAAAAAEMAAAEHRSAPPPQPQSPEQEQHEDRFRNSSSPAASTSPVPLSSTYIKSHPRLSGMVGEEDSLDSPGKRAAAVILGATQFVRKRANQRRAKRSFT